MPAKVNGKSKAHIRYQNQNGDVVPGVTTIIGQLNKPQLIIWANKLGLAGIDSSKFRDDKADIGTLAHALILADLRGEKFDTSEYSKEQIDQAENSFLYYLDWAKGKQLEPILMESPLVSEKYQFGGTFDYYGEVNDELCLVDYKTGGIYKESYIQTSAYVGLLVEQGHEIPDKIIILGIPRTTDEKFQEVTYTSHEKGWETFLHLRRVYDLLKDMK